MKNKNAILVSTHNSIGYIFQYMLSLKLQNDKDQKNLNFVYIIYRKNTPTFYYVVENHNRRSL